MKKIIIMLLLIATLMLTGCGKQTVEVVEQTEAPKVEETEIVEKEPEKEPDGRMVAVMIDNDDERARPQAGLESAKIVYEIIVEGGSTRFLALFDDYKIEKVGPVRSARHYFLDYALEHDAIYCHCGWSPKAQSDIPALGIKNINGILGNDGNAYYRDRTYDNSWHNLYTSLPRLTDMAKKKGYSLELKNKHLSYSEEEYDLNGEACETVVIPYSNLYKVKYEYDEENKVYKRYVNNREHISQINGILTAKNIIVYKVSNYELNDGENKGRQEISNIGQGTGYYISNGQAVEINWSKSSRGAKTIYTTTDGKELLLNKGNTYIQIMPKSFKLTIE
jgi:hypothetical protein